jgi:phage protein D
MYKGLEDTEVDDEKRARGGKRTSETKIAEVSTSKSKKRTKKEPAETPEPAKAQNVFDDPGRHSDEYMKHSHLKRAANDATDGKITLEELDNALNDAVTDHNIRLAGQGAFYNVPEEPATIEFSMEAFQRSARARRPPRAHCRAYVQRKAPPVVRYPT